MSEESLLLLRLSVIEGGDGANGTLVAGIMVSETVEKGSEVLIPVPAV